MGIRLAVCPHGDRSGYGRCDGRPRLGSVGRHDPTGVCSRACVGESAWTIRDRPDARFSSDLPLWSRRNELGHGIPHSRAPRLVPDAISASGRRVGIHASPILSAIHGRVPDREATWLYGGTLMGSLTGVTVLTHGRQGPLAA